LRTSSYNSFAPEADPDFASQDTVWNDIGIKVLEHAWNGFNVSLFAYGQTGSGKSFSMVGYGAEKGIIPRASEVIFERIDSTASGVVFKVEASMMEIYNEHVKGTCTCFVCEGWNAWAEHLTHTDLFNPSSDNLKIRDHPRHGPYPEGLTRHAVSSYQEISTVRYDAQRNRQAVSRPSLDTLLIS
jgi:kinesin family member 1